MSKLIFIFVIALSPASIAATGGDVETHFLEVFICQGHSLMKIQDFVNNNKEIEFRGFYPPGRIENELKFYTEDDLNRCQSVQKALTQPQVRDLKNFIKKIEIELANPESGLIFYLSRSSFYDMLKFNCVDFSQMFLRRYFNQSIPEAFASENKTLQIYCDPLEPCFGNRNPENCLQLGIDKAALFTHFRQGVSSLLLQMAQEKPILVLGNTAVIAVFTWRGAVKSLLLLSAIEAFGASAHGIMNYRRPEQVSAAEWVLPQLVFSLYGLVMATIQTCVPQGYRLHANVVLPIVAGGLIMWLSPQADDVESLLEFVWKQEKG